MFKKAKQVTTRTTQVAAWILALALLLPITPIILVVLGLMEYSSIPNN